MFLVVAALAQFGAAPRLGAGAATMSELQDQRNQLKEQMKALNDSISSISDKQKQLEQKIATLNARTDNMRAQINNYIASIDVTQGELSAKQAELDQKERDIAETYEIYKQRLRAMYMSNDTSLLTLLLQSNSIADFLESSEALKRVSKHDTELINTLTREKEAIDAAKAEIEDKLSTLEAEKAELDSAYEQLAALIRESNAALSENEALKAAKQAEYDKVQSEFRAVEDDIAKLSASSGGDFIGGDFRWPVPGYSYISYYFGYRTDPVSGATGDFHRGIDIAGWNIYGKTVIASNTGRVIKAVYGSTGYGIYVIIDHGGGVTTVYAHMSSISVSVGQYVYQGDKVGEVGSSGYSSGPHLHFSVYVNGYAKNPLNYVKYGW